MLIILIPKLQQIRFCLSSLMNCSRLINQSCSLRCKMRDSDRSKYLLIIIMIIIP